MTEETIQTTAESAQPVDANGNVILPPAEPVNDNAAVVTDDGVDTVPDAPASTLANAPLKKFNKPFWDKFHEWVRDEEGEMIRGAQEIQEWFETHVL